MATKLENLHRKSTDIMDRRGSLVDERLKISDNQATIKSILDSFSDQTEIEIVSILDNAIEEDSKAVQNRIKENENDRGEAIEETENYIASLENNLHKLQELKNITDLGSSKLDAEQSTKARIDKLREIRELLEGEESLNRKNNIEVNNEDSLYPLEDKKNSFLESLKVQVEPIRSEESIYSEISNVAIKLSGKEWAENLTSAEHSAVRDYTGTSYVNINAVLRGLESEFDTGNHERASLIHRALSRSRIPQPCTVYRGASLSSLGEYANATDAELIGNIISDDGFMSTSLNSGDAFGGEVRYEISVPKGANGAYVGYLSQAQHYESEVLFDCGQILQITDVKRDMFGNRTIVARILV